MNSSPTFKFVHGPMSAGKSTFIFSTAYHVPNARLLSPLAGVYSRAFDQNMEAIDISDGEILPKMVHGADLLIVDEAQFMSPESVWELRRLAVKFGVDVDAFGLLTDIGGRLFPGSQAWIEAATFVKVLPHSVGCLLCSKDASRNAIEADDGTLLFDAGLLGDSETASALPSDPPPKFVPLCVSCHRSGAEEFDRNLD